MPHVLINSHHPLPKLQNISYCATNSMATSFSNQITIILFCLLSTIIFNSSSLVMCNSMIIHCDKKDENTLLKFKHEVTDPSGVLSSWSSDEEKDCCQWRGVHCDNITHRVIELHLPCDTIQSDEILDKDNAKPHCLTGEFDMSSLFDLEFLSYLDLSNNDFKTIKYDFNSIHNNKTCNDSSNIHYLDLAYNYHLFSDYNNMLHQISHLFSSLQFLDLSGIDFYKETDWLQSLTSLSSLLELHLDDCSLKDINPSLQYANLTSLKVLSLVSNDFSTILPSWLFNLSHISYIDLSENYLHGQLPQTLPKFHQSIESLCLYTNDLDGPIPDWLGQLDQLKALALSYNNFDGQISTILENLPSLLIELRLHSNFLTGTVSEKNFHLLSKLKNLGLGSEYLVFDFDTKWIPSFQLQILVLENVGPKFPSWIYTQSSLELLFIWNSRVSFEPLGKFWKFAAQLEALALVNNSINADISNVLLDSKVVIMQLNNFRGSVPQVSSKVTFLDLSYNNLSDISPFLCQKMKGKRNLETLFISDNALSGEIPNCLMNWTSLLQVDLRNNNLTGKIPHSIGSLSRLIFFSLEKNKLFGEIPLSLKDCKNLQYLILGGNAFSGTIPSWINQRIKILQLGSNQFSGNIPIEVCQFYSLKILDLSNNKLSGSIPNCLHNMTSMISPYASMDVFKILTRTKYSKRGFSFVYFRVVTKYMVLDFVHSICLVDLSSNEFFGTIPSGLFMLIGLQSLNLSHNQLMGSISQHVSNLTLLESLDLSNNLLSGQIPQSMSGMSFLEVLNLSCNNFEGKIPLGTQLESFTNFSYVGNPKLCGPPLTKLCQQDEKLPNENQKREEDDDDDDSYEVCSWFFMGWELDLPQAFGEYWVLFFSTEKDMVFQIFKYIL
ncbi:receptor-like protein EIX2 isoform X1 [Arachis duranensis]|uniref:Receptor-like protein EIX2 isoform X1 n=1 Tax=Arachis duranensis TaxID=130453 RepID=A0A9C6T4B7_ARADU|nr:receptor-like protein EIX2 isoform X1 [Arachis duranensis]